MLKFFLSISLLICTFSLQAQISQVLVKDIAYRPTSTDENINSICLLDIAYYPTSDNLPVIIWFHEGDLTNGSNIIPTTLINKGFVICSVGYRLLSNDTMLSDCIDDAAAAVSWVHDNINKWGGNPSKICVAGITGGAYLALMIAFDNKWLKKFDKNTSIIKLIASYCGNTISKNKFLENSSGSVQISIDEYSPLFHVHENSPTVLLVCSDKKIDNNGIFEENDYLRRMLSLNGNNNIKLIEIEGVEQDNIEFPANQLLIDYLNKSDF
jgi:dipeptidyl aminopeptidase/acylaminoacyl peptidase